MSRRKAILGIAVLCVAAFGAISAAGASAAGTTAYTCVKGTPAEFSNADCSSALGTKEWRHESFAVATNTHLLVAAATNQVFETELAAVEFEFEATAVEAVTANSKIENTEEAGVMHAGGLVRLKYSGVVVHEPAGCEVEDPTSGVKGVVTTETLTFKSNAAREIEFSPPANGIYAEIKIVNCIIFAGTYSVKGTWAATTSGATWSYGPATENLTMGGEELSLTGTVTVSGTDTAKPTVTNPLALT